ncbi:hypothetical protein bcere0029_43570 [Bacillus cereus AH1272]|nr:hypothetical protein bcere0029_43570 [Bacillus cereus AH1272]EEL91653.1 hypothetical protein bcere0030_43470 [Bacillus cereus AH1273]
MKVREIGKEKREKIRHTLQVHQVDLVITVVTIVVAQVIVEEIAEVVEIKLVFSEERLMKGCDERWKL